MSTDSDIQAIAAELMDPGRRIYIPLVSLPGTTVAPMWVDHKNRAEAMVLPPKGGRHVIAGWHRVPPQLSEPGQTIEAVTEQEYAKQFAVRLLEVLNDPKRSPA